MELHSSASHPKDDNLIKMALQGDQQALDVLLTRYRRLLYDLARRILRNHEEAEDAVQNCSLLAYRNLCNVKGEGSFRSWLVRILINEALAIVRKKKSRSAAAPAQSPSEGDSLEGFPAAVPDLERAFAKRESVGALMEHLVRLPAPLRSAIMICDVGEHSIEDASVVLSLAPNTVRVRLHRGRAKLGLAMRGGRARRNVYDVSIGV